LEPFLIGVIALGGAKETYQPFVFLTSYKPDGETIDVWFSASSGAVKANTRDSSRGSHASDRNTAPRVCSFDREKNPEAKTRDPSRGSHARG
jgi:hypothetical protein